MITTQFKQTLASANNSMKPINNLRDLTKILQEGGPSFNQNGLLVKDTEPNALLIQYFNRVFQLIQNLKQLEDQL